jgi:hypothetical protein
MEFDSQDAVVVDTDRCGFPYGCESRILKVACMRVWLVFRGAEWSLAAILTSDEINSLEQTVGTQ